MNRSTAESADRMDNLRDEINLLGSLLGETIKAVAGEDAFASVEKLRSLAWNRRSGVAQADCALTDFIASLNEEQLRVAIRAFTIFMDLLNLAEDRQRVRTLAQRAAAAYPAPHRESVSEAVSELKALGLSNEAMQSLLNRVQIELVFTAHPTDAKRRSVRQKLRRLRDLLAENERSSSKLDKANRNLEIRSELLKLWQTDFIRPWRPSIMQEVGRGLSIKPVLWEEVPKIQQELAEAIEESFGDGVQATRPVFRFGSWIGGDRDGHPGVTSEVTKQTLSWLRESALEFHLQACKHVADSLSLSSRETHFPAHFEQAIARSVASWQPLQAKLADLPPSELCRQWLTVIEWRLVQSKKVTLEQPEVYGAYGGSKDLLADIEELLNTLESLPSGELLAHDVRLWAIRTRVFGFHLARLDVRQDSRVYKEVLNELFQQTSLHSAPNELTELERRKLILDSMNNTLHQRVNSLSQFQRPESANVAATPSLSAVANDSLGLFRVLKQTAQTFGPEALGGHVISMTGQVSDVLTVLWFWRCVNSSNPLAYSLPIVPLFETIQDLQNAKQILSDMLSCPEYREYLRGQQDQQMIMLGYSDSTKDGGYLSACWSLHQAQRELVEIAREHQVELTFFHGRGGSLGRGGGPAARSILSLPVGTFHGSLRLTEQGEVLAERYDDPAIANRHLEQVLWSSLLAAGRPTPADNVDFVATMDRLSQASFSHYRKLVEQPDFVEFFRLTTPISEIEQLPIGSRPSRRRSGASLSDLRAIPWVFSWTQCRCLIPAWYGLGTAFESLKEVAFADRLLDMYRNWPFFRACIDNAELALAKTDIEIAKQYASLAGKKESLNGIASMIEDEYARSRRAVLMLTGKEELLDSTPWLKESIRVRNRYIDPLNMIQVELMRRGRDNSSKVSEEELRHLHRLSINGLAAGMRTSG